MKARELMTSPAIRVRESTPAREATALLTEHAFASLPVVDEHDRVVGIFTEYEALRDFGGTASGAERAVGSVMTAPVEVVTLETDVSEVAKHMLADRLRCIPVVDDDQLVGVISRRDLLRTLVRRDDVVAAHLRTRLENYSGAQDYWTVSVTGGVVTVSGEFRDTAERQLVEALVRTEPGVLEVETVTPHVRYRPSPVEHF
ncbi:CBS domain-containing protein [Haloechinothrix sp. YIM 98757]|uniref:CBS domain-containing protein n=1 Tax=Haloechinothrix aidingensis TaxID=2752311 RepID=A0A838ACA8_9PSEU|nr:CBS domain-containing protein [Haloechinothrix aidingensis]MBA0126896.1 CBS domain-containing protein [Haloechinothrix aidingensis]